MNQFFYQICLTFKDYYKINGQVKDFNFVNSFHSYFDLDQVKFLLFLLILALHDMYMYVRSYRSR